MSEHWQHFQDLLAAENEIKAAKWHAYEQADAQTKLLMEPHLNEMTWRDMMVACA